MTECDNIRLRYDRRASQNLASVYATLLPYSYLSLQEKERAIIRWIITCEIAPVEKKRVLEIGCGSGGNLLDLLRLGFQPENLVGNELLEERAKGARKRMPAATRIIPGDAADAYIPDGPFDIVLQSTVFTSILDDQFQKKLADRMWSLVKPGGGVLWYDFIYDNPSNPDVRGVSLRRIKALFPNAKINYWRLTLAPPIGRLVTKLHPSLYTLFNLFPFLRTHILCWIQKGS